MNDTFTNVEWSYIIDFFLLASAHFMCIWIIYLVNENWTDLYPLFYSCIISYIRFSVQLMKFMDLLL